MYIHGLTKSTRQNRFAALAVTDEFSIYPDTTAQAARRCVASGGYPVIGYTAYDANRQGIASSAYVRACQMPQVASSPAANVVVSVPTTVSAQISPQISPNLIQQDQPQNSPVTAGTQQTTGAQPVSQSAMQDMIDARLAAEAAGNADLLDALRQAMQAGQPGVMTDPGPTGSNPAAVVSPVPETAVAGPSPSLQTLGIVAGLAVAAVALFGKSDRKRKG